jgi:hypothetical protein
LKLTIARLDVLVWLLIYGGLLGASLGLALARNGVGFGWGLVIVGATAAGAGTILVWVRSRMRDPLER